MSKSSHAPGFPNPAGTTPQDETGPVTPIPSHFRADVDHLDDVTHKLDEACRQAADSAIRFDKDYAGFKRYMSQYRGEIDPHEMLQNELALRHIDMRGAFAVQHRDRLARLRDSPFFARIDFREASASDPTAFYIGRSSFSHAGTLMVSDWRSPVAGMFYDNEVGPAGYDAPAGPIAGALTLKRQFRITRGRMDYAIESSLAIQDDVLQLELSRPSGTRMRAIIATIQREQNQIIRNERAHTLIVQGVAGSGKTSIALHRIAYLLYRLTDRLSSRHVTIISPNRVFGNHISDVLPELGEEPVHTTTVATIARTQLDGLIQFEPPLGPDGIGEGLRGERARHKSSLAFLEQLTSFLDRRLQTIFEPSDWSWGHTSISAAWIRDRFRTYHMYPVKQRLAMIADNMRDRVESASGVGERLPTAGSIARQLAAGLTVKNPITLYRQFFTEAGIPKMFVLAGRRTLEWSDVFPFLLVQITLEGPREYQPTRHLVIDEMQDYSPVQHAVLETLFRCPKTILGDFGQSTNPLLTHSLADLVRLYRRADVVELNRSYRSTREIMALATRIRKTPALEVVDRRGESPVVLACTDEHDELARIRERLAAFRSSRYVTLAVITKTQAEAHRLHQLLSRDGEVHLIAPDSVRFASGVSVSSVHMAKGLEFDEVLIPSVTHDSFSAEHDRALLYVACTRALHRLCLTYTGTASRFIQSE